MKDNFAQINLPNLEFQPEYTFLDLPQFQQPELLNCVEKLLDSHIKEGRGNVVCIRTFEETWTYQDLYEKANQIAHETGYRYHYMMVFESNPIEGALVVGDALRLVGDL